MSMMLYDLTAEQKFGVFILLCVMLIICTILYFIKIKYEEKINKSNSKILKKIFEQL